MRGETQALHLAKMMQNHTHYPQYELALPLVSVRSSKLKKLSLNDVLLLDFKVLEFILIEGANICADLVLQRAEDSHVIIITHLHRKTILSNESHKFKTVKLSFGECQIKNSEVGDTLDMTQFDLGKVTLIADEKKIAEGSLINVDNEIAVKINNLF